MGNSVLEEVEKAPNQPFYWAAYTGNPDLDKVYKKMSDNSKIEGRKNAIADFDATTGGPNGPVTEEKTIDAVVPESMPEAEVTEDVENIVGEIRIRFPKGKRKVGR